MYDTTTSSVRGKVRLYGVEVRPYSSKNSATYDIRSDPRHEDDADEWKMSDAHLKLSDEKDERTSWDEQIIRPGSEGGGGGRRLT